MPNSCGMRGTLQPPSPNAPPKLVEEEAQDGNAKQNLSRPYCDGKQPGQGILSGTWPHAPRACILRQALSRRAPHGERVGWSDAQPSARSGRLRCAGTPESELPGKKFRIARRGHFRDTRRRAARRFRDRGFACNRRLHSLQGRLHNLSSFFSFSLPLQEKIRILCERDSWPHCGSFLLSVQLRRRERLRSKTSRLPFPTLATMHAKPRTL